MLSFFFLTVSDQEWLFTNNTLIYPEFTFYFLLTLNVSKVATVKLKPGKPRNNTDFLSSIDLFFLYGYLRKQVYSTVQKFGVGKIVFVCFWKKSLLHPKAAFIWPNMIVTWSFRNHSNMLIYCSRNISDYYQCWKQLCCTIFLWKWWYFLFFRIHRWIGSSKEQHLFEIEIFCYIINVFIATFDQFNACLMNNKCINKKKNLTNPKLITQCRYSV